MKAQIEQLEKENKKLKEDNRFLTKISKEYMKKENIIEITEFTELYKDKLEEENRKLKEKVEELENELEYVRTIKDSAEKTLKEVREENKKLRELKCVPSNLKTLIRIDKENERLEEENKKLKSDLAFKETMLDNVSAEYDSSQDVIKELKEKIRFLEQCLDNKEKVNKSLREDLKIWKLTAKDYAKLCWVDLDDK